MKNFSGYSKTRPRFRTGTTSQFQKIIHAHYRTAGRSMPWRNAKNPYHIFVSEVMLQQTQVERVREKYGEFIKKFPHFRALSVASVSEVLRAWQGLGYNRRALFLKRAAEEIVRVHGGKAPRETNDLEALAGIGPATARAIRAFAFNEPEVFIETNIRSVYLHFFFPKRKNVSDKKLLPLIEKTLDRANPREWYYALMDYGAMLKKTIANPSRQSAAHKKQPRFAGSLRETRGAIVRLLLHKAPYSLKEIQKELPFEKERTIQAVRELEKEGLIKKSERNRYSISEKIS
ncbi:MAG: A/G-specific adenine glycosylase [Parcubacteria group bacterium]|nr:A/G-specific adenine glycosylase [Parcubacteria group bacterium]